MNHNILCPSARVRPISCGGLQPRGLKLTMPARWLQGAVGGMKRPMIDLPTERYLALKAAMMPRDTNKEGTIFGGVLLSYADLAAEIGARNVLDAQGLPAHSMVTVAMDRVEFREPVFVGDTVSFWTRVTRIGRSSISIHVSVETERNASVIAVTEADVTYVAVKTEGNIRRPVPLDGE